MIKPHTEYKTPVMLRIDLVPGDVYALSLEEEGDGQVEELD